MGCNCGNKNRQAKLQQQVNRAKDQQSLSPNKVATKDYLKQIESNKKK